MFTLHPQLAKDTLHLGNFPLSRLLLMNDSQFPWFILVPEVESISEIYQLTQTQQAQLLRESSYLAQTLATLYCADKMNIAALGNVVPQLHLHHIVRFKSDPVWLAPVWGKLPACAYSDAELEALKQRVFQTLRFDLRF